MSLRFLDKKVFAVLSVSLVLMAAVSFAADKKVPVKVAQPVAPQTAPSVPSAPVVSPVTQAAVQSGVLTCTSRINQVTTFLINNNQSGAFLFKPSAYPDRHVFSTSMEVRSAKGAGIYTTASFVPNPDGGCDAVYDVVEFSPKACADIEKDISKSIKREGILKQDISIFDAGAAKIFLMPAGNNGCVVIKKEVVQ
jgi:hypothetical protein